MNRSWICLTRLLSVSALYLGVILSSIMPLALHAQRGTVYGGEDPIAGGHIYLFAVGTGGFGTGATSLLHGSGVTLDSSNNGYLTADSGGNFNLTGHYASYCPTPSSNVYLMSVGGDPGVGVNNPAITEISAMPWGCSDLPNAPGVRLNELTTVAAAWSLAAFATPSTNSFATNAPNIAAIAKAFADANNLVYGFSGGVQSTDMLGHGYVPAAKINTMADILASCIYSNGGTPCTNLFSATTPSGGTAPVNTLQAALNIALNPSINVSGIYNLLSSSSSVPFTPTLTASPSDWTFTISYGQFSFSSAMINAIAGNNTSGFSGDGGPATSAALYEPAGVAKDSAGNTYISDAGNGRIRKIDAVTGTISTVAGNAYGTYSGDGTVATNASLGYMAGIAVDRQVNLYYIEQGCTCVHKIDASTGLLSTVAGNGSHTAHDGVSATSSGLFSPTQIILDDAGNLYIVDSGNNRIRKVSAATGIITTVAGNGSNSGTAGDGGPATSAVVSLPTSIALDSGGNLYIAQSNGLIRKVSAATGIIGIATAGSGTIPAIGPSSISVDSNNGNIYFSNNPNFYGYTSFIREINATTGAINTIAGKSYYSYYDPLQVGDGGPATNAEIVAAPGLALDNTGSVYFVDGGANEVRKIGSQGVLLFDTTAVGGTALPQSVTISNQGNAPLVFTGAPSITGDFSLPSGNTCGVNTLAPGASCTLSVVYSPTSVGSHSGQVTFPNNGSYAAPVLMLSGLSTNQAPTVTASMGSGPVVYGQGFAAFGSVSCNSSCGTVRVILDGNVAAAGAAQPISSSGTFYLSAPNPLPDIGPHTLQVLYDGNKTYNSALSNTINFVVVPQTPYLYWDTITRILNSGDPLPASVLNATASVPGTFAYSLSAGSVLGLGNHTITATFTPSDTFHYTTTGTITNLVTVVAPLQNAGALAFEPSLITTAAGNGTPYYSGDGGSATQAAFGAIAGATVDPSGDLYLVDYDYGALRKVSAATGTITTYDANNYSGGDPTSMASDRAGNLYIADGNGYVEMVQAATGNVVFFAAAQSFCNPTGVAVDKLGDLFISDNCSAQVYEIPISTGQLTLIAGSSSGSYTGEGGPAVNAPLDNPMGVAVDDAGNVYIADGNAIRKVAAGTGIITTIAGGETAGSTGDGGPATSALLNSPRTIAIDAAGDIFVADFGNQKVRKIAAGTSIITTVAGNGVAGFSGDGGPATNAKLSSYGITGIALDRAGTLYIADAGNYVIRKVGPQGAVSFGAQTVGTSATSSVTLANRGNSTLHFNGITVSGDFAIPGGNVCGVQDMAPGASCAVNVTFTPTDGGSRTGSIAFVEDGVLPTQSVALMGTGTAAATVTTLSTQNPTPFYFGQPILLVAHVTAGSMGATGTVSFSDGGTVLGTANLDSGVATFAVMSPALGSHSFTATYTGTLAYTSSAGSPVPLAVQASPTTTFVTLSPPQSYAGYPVLANVTIRAAGGTVPTAGGSILCTVTPPGAAAFNPPAVTLNGTSSFAQVIITGLGLTNGSTYSVTCAFTSNDTSQYLNSDSTAQPVTGTVVQPVPGSITPSFPLVVARAGHQSTRLNDGSVLVSGGTSGGSPDNPAWIPGCTDPNNLDCIKSVVEPAPLASTEIFTPGLGFALAAPMTTPRYRHQATLLSNQSGQVLITGGDGDGKWATLNSAELFTPGTTPGSPGSFAVTTYYDPNTKSFSTTQSKMNDPRYLHTATLLPDGKVLLAGGWMATVGVFGNGTVLDSAELYDPATGTFTRTARMSVARWMHTATLLNDGTVLITGGQDSSGNMITSAEIYHPKSGTFTLTGMDKYSFATTLQGRGRSLAQATLLADGTVLITGGATSDCGPYVDGSGYPNIRMNCSLADAQIYDPATEMFSYTQNSGSQTSMSWTRYEHTATLRADGTVLIAGGVTNRYSGYTSSGYSNNINDAPVDELYDPRTGQFTTVGNMLTARWGHTATVLPDYSILVTGGESGDTLGYLAVSASESYGIDTLTAGVHPKYMVLDIMYAPPGTGSTMTYTDQTMVGGTTSSTNSFAQNVSIGGAIPGIKAIGKLTNKTEGFNFTQTVAGTSSYTVTTTTADTTAVPGPVTPNAGVDHEADIVWLWLNPQADYTVATPTSLVWNGYSTNPNDPNVAEGQMDIVPVTIGQLDGTSPMPAGLTAILDRNWDPVADGGAGGLTHDDRVTILKRDPFATNLSADGINRSTAVTNQAVAPVYPVYDPHIPTLDPVTGTCGYRYTFDPVNGQTFPFTPLGFSSGDPNATPSTAVSTQPITSVYAISSANTLNWNKTTTDTYSVGLSLAIKASGKGLGPLWNLLANKDSAAWTFVNSWNPATANATTTTQTLSIKNPLPKDKYTGPNQMQVWQDNLYGTYLFYPKTNDTTVVIKSSQSALGVGQNVTFTATVVPDPTMPAVPTGTITFYDTLTCLPLGSAVTLDGSGAASYSTSTLSGGTHPILALYSGDNVYFHNVSTAFNMIVGWSAAPAIGFGGVSPASGPIGTQVTIAGANFGYSQDASSGVTFNGIPASITSWSDTSIVATVPYGATTGPLTVTVDGYTSTNPVFTVTQPSATSTTTTMVLSPVTAWAGYPVTATVRVTAQSGVVFTGTVSCASSPSNGTTSTTIAVNSTGIAVVPVTDVPWTPTNYSVTCTFNPASGSNLSGSTSNTVAGSIVAVPDPTTAAGVSLSQPRENHQATLLNDGTVLVTGGDSGTQGYQLNGTPPLYLDSAEIYVDGTSPFLGAAQMTTPRSLHQATLLSNSTGQVLITGGTSAVHGGQAQALSSAELFTPGTVPGAPGNFALTTLYDPAAKQFTNTVTSMNMPRFWHTSTLLPSGKVLITGGTTTIGDYNGTPYLASYGINYHPGQTPSMALNTAELYDPQTGKFTYTSGQMNVSRTQHTATLLIDGTVLLTGGQNNNGTALSSAEIYNPVTDTFTPIANSMTAVRAKHQATRLGLDGYGRTGTVLLSGGLITNQNCPGLGGNPCSTPSAEIYDPVAKTFTAVPVSYSCPSNGGANCGRYSHTATVLYDGTVLLAGGISNWFSGYQNTQPTEEIYNPISGQFTKVVPMVHSRFNHTATLLPTGGVLLIGGQFGAREGTASIALSETYTPAAITGGVHPKFMVLNVMYAPPGSGSSVTYSNSTQVGTNTVQTQTKSNALTISLGGSVGIANIAQVNGGYTFAQNSNTTYGVSTTLTDTTTVAGASDTLLSDGVTVGPTPGVDHEADVIWVWINPESDFTQTTASSLVWTGYATNPADTNVASGEMDVIPLTVSQLDGTSPIPQDLLELLNRNWDPLSAGGAGPITHDDFMTILKRDPFATRLEYSHAATAATNVPLAPTSDYPVVDPNILTHDVNDTAEPNQCGQRYSLASGTGQTFQFAPLGSSNQPFTQTYSLATNQTNSNGQSASDTYSAGLSLGICFDFGLGCDDTGSKSDRKGTKFKLNLMIGDTYSWGHKWGSTLNTQSGVAQSLTIKSPSIGDQYTGPTQMQVWQDNLYGTFMFYPKPTDTVVTVSSSQATAQAGDLVTFSATITPDTAMSLGGSPVPTGNVTFYDGCEILRNPNQATTQQPVVNGIATVTSSWASAGNHNILAVYSGDSTYFHNDAPLLQQNVLDASANLPYINPGGLVPSSGSVGTTVSISGQNFGAPGVVTFNGVPATSVSWNSSSSITATVPAGATTGPVVVTPGNTTHSSNGVPFTVTVGPSSTISTLTLSPVISWSGHAVTAHVVVTGQTGSTIQGAVSCTVNSASGTTSVGPFTLSPPSVSVDIPLSGLPTVASGTASTATYTASCTFTNGNPNYSGSTSNSVTGTVTNSPTATDTVLPTVLNIARQNHQANLLLDGTVLITGGVDGSNAPLVNAELYTGDSFNLASPMTTARSGHQATLLSNSTGQVLITGGSDGSTILNRAELFSPGPLPGTPGSFDETTLYDPTAEDFTSTVSSMNTPRQYHSATQLRSGKVLLVGGTGTYGVTLGSAELYDPTTGAFTSTAGSLSHGRSKHTATLLNDGTVLIAGGVDAYGNALNSGEIYDPSTDMFRSITAAMVSARVGAQATQVNWSVSTSQKYSMVLIAGGTDAYGNPVSGAELYNPANATFASTKDASSNSTTSPIVARSSQTATLLYDGTVLFAGGAVDSYGDTTASEELYDPTTGDFGAATASLATDRSGHTATLLSNGSVLLVGGYNSGSGSLLSSAEIFSSSFFSGNLFPKFMVLDVLYAPPGTGSSVTYTNQTGVGTSTSTDLTFSTAHTVSVAATVSLKPWGIPVTLSPSFQWGHTFTQDGTSSFGFSTTTTNTTVVPGASANGVNHEADIIQIWLNPGVGYTGAASSSAPNVTPLLWNGYTTNPDDTNVAPGEMDVVSLSVSQLDGTSPIPTELRTLLSRNWDSTASGGAGGLTADNFRTILKRDSFATNTSLDNTIASVNNPQLYFDPNIPVPDPLSNNTCSTRYSFDPVFGQTFPFGQLGATNQPYTQTYSLQSGSSNVSGHTTTDQYSVEVVSSAKIGIPKVATFSLKDDKTFTWTNTYSRTDTNSSTATQTLSIKNPPATDSYSGPTQMQVWHDDIYGTYMFYPKPSDTYVALTSSQSVAGSGDTVMLTARITADAHIAASTNPPLTPTGSVVFYDGCVVLGSATIQQTGVATGIASISVPLQTVGNHSILAAYSGDTHFLHNTSVAGNISVTTADSAQPYIGALSPPSGPVGTSVSIGGVNLGSSGTVTFNGIAAATTNWTPNSITATVPAGATTGQVIVTTSGATSNGPIFAVDQAAGYTDTWMTLVPATTWSGYPTRADIFVSGSANTTPTGTVSCVATAPGFTGTPTTGVALNSAGYAEVIVSALPTIGTASSVPYSVTCSFTGSGGAGNSASTTAGTIVPIPPATEAATGNLAVARENHQTTLIQDGSVLVTGGDDGSYPLASAELYVNGQFQPAASMTTPRTGHQQTVLGNTLVQVLITGGSSTNNASGALNTAELFTPSLTAGLPGSFTITTQFDPVAGVSTHIPTHMTTARYRHAATMLTTNQVLIVGGADATNQPLDSAEIYDPVTGVFTATNKMHIPRIAPNITLLLDGTVLISGGVDGSGAPIQSAELYNVTGQYKSTFTYTMDVNKVVTQMVSARVGAQATRLGSGQVLFTGGQDVYGNVLQTAELYDPLTGTFTVTHDAAHNQSSMTVGRFGHTASLLYDNTVLISGGQDTPASTLSSQELYDPVAGTFSAIGVGLQLPRHNFTSTTLPTEGVLIVGGENTTSSGSSVSAAADLYSPLVNLVGLHPKYMVANIEYAPPGSGSTMTYGASSTMGSSTGTDYNFQQSESVTYQTGLGPLASLASKFGFTRKTTKTWASSSDFNNTFSLNTVIANTEVVPGPLQSSLGVDHESDIVWIWLNPVANYTITSPQSIVWNGLGADSNDPNGQDGPDIIPLSVSQLDGTSPITPAERAILDRNWDPISSGGSGPITNADLATILARDPFATNLTGVGRSTAPTAMATGNQYPIFDPNLPTFDPITNQCGNRYDFSPGFDMTFPYASLGKYNQAITQTYSLSSNVAQATSSTTTDTYKVPLSTDLAPATKTETSPPVSIADINPSPLAQAINSIAKLLPTIGTFSGQFTWTDKWTTTKNNASLQTQALAIKSPVDTDLYSGPEQIQVWKDNLYGTFMFYPKPNDTTWILASSQNTVNASTPFTLTATATVDPHALAIPRGSVTFYDGCNSIGSGDFNASTGSVVVNAVLTGSGTHTIRAIYSGDTVFYHNNSNSIVVTVP